MNGAVVGVDLDSANIAASIVTPQGRLLRHRAIATPLSDAPAVAATIRALVEEVAAGQPLAAVGIASTGLVNSARTEVVFAPNLPLRQAPLAGLLSRMVGVPVVLENYTNAAAWAESRFGVGRNRTSLVMLTIGTGIGGGIVIGGQLLRGANGMGGELGHVYVADNPDTCRCGSSGCLEVVASGTALLREVRKLVAENPRRAPVLARLAGHDLAGLTAAHIATAARKGDSVALAALAQLGDRLGRGLAAILAILDVEAIVLGGGVAAAGELLRVPTLNALQSNLLARSLRKEPVVLLSSLGPAAALLGAADLARITQAPGIGSFVSHDQAGTVPQ